ncbi:MAG: LegC family aminotransferase [Candidatus Fournierella pullistercoris]|uniref:LegC family aminotransferase n=1 Tax=Candidatus Allofournierella pullistercoris TaxID=2838597 RepID=A0A948T331_9FIRM|nr:LegC family aminotransferase [Candidatus Fournierella pullistercoris]
MANFIPLSVPNFSGKEKEYVNDAVVSEWVSTGGSKVGGFEQAIADYVKMPRAVACNSGTSGLHLAMLCAGIGAGDEVIAPTLTFIAAINPIRYVCAEPVFIGCDDTLCIDPKEVKRFCEEECQMVEGQLVNKTSNRPVKALLIVHVFGNMAKMEELMEIAKTYNLKVIEDATEALGTYYTSGIYAGKYAGTIGDVGVYSFNGNKLITTGSGGMLVSNHPDWAEHAKHLSTQAKSDELQFFHDEVGYNYRLTNLQAALGLAQMEQIEGFIAHKHQMWEMYRQALDGKNGLRLLKFRDEEARCNKWFYAVYLEDARHDRDTVLKTLAEQGIQTRPVWALIHEQADYGRNQVFGAEKAQDYRSKIVNIPCSTNLTQEDCQRVIDALLAL